MGRKTSVSRRWLLLGSVVVGIVIGTIYFNIFYWNRELGITEVYYSLTDIIKQVRFNQELLSYILLFRLKQGIILVLLFCLLPVRLFSCMLGAFVGFSFSIVCCLQIISLSFL